MTPGWEDLLPEELSLARRRGPTAERVEDGRPVLEGRHDWVVEGPPDRITDIVEVGTGYAERLGDRVALLDFGNAVGRIQVPHLGTVRVVSGKWDGSDFDAMLEAVVRRSAELPFRAGETGALPYTRSVAHRRRILYHCFVYLRHVLSDEADSESRLDRAYRTVLREPHREWRRSRETVDVGRARRVDGKSLETVVARSDEFVAVRGSRARATALSRALGGRLPSRIDERRDYASVDTAENRFLKTFLEQIQRIIDDIGALARESDRNRLKAQVLPACDAMRKKLRPIVRHSIWDDVGELTSVPAASTVLQRRRGYCALFRHYSRLRMAVRLPLSEQGAADLLEVKDIALLYELWTFFRLSELIEERLSRPVEAASVDRSPWGAKMRWSTQIRWAGGVTLTYNPSFSRSKPSSRRSYSVPLRPDVALEIPEGSDAGLHLFDAKFRLRTVREAMPERGNDTDTDASEAAERRGDFKRGDLYKMHTYRDAIPGVASVWILYPGDVGRFYDTSGARWQNDEGELVAKLDGVGALPLVPGGASQEVAGAVLDRVLQAPASRMRGSGFRSVEG